MALILPDFYQGGCPDVERDVLRPLFQPLLTKTHVVSWIPKPDVYSREMDDGWSYLRTYRTGGAWNDDQSRDEPRVQLAAFTSSRDQSWQLIEFVRQILICFIRQSAVVPGTQYKLSAVGEVAGPQLIPELLQDDRIVPITFQLYTWKPKGLPDYRAALHLDL